MKRTPLYLLSFFILSLLVLPCRASAFIGLDAGIGYWRQAPSGTMNYKGSDIDLKDDMNLDAKGRPFVRIKAELPLILPNLYFMATPMSFTGTRTLSKDISFGGKTFSASTAIESKLKMDHYDLALFYPIPLLNTVTAGKLTVELGLDARQLVFEGTIQETSGTISSSKKQTLYVPLVYAAVQVNPLSVLGIEAELRAIGYSKNHYYDFIGRIRVMPVGPLFISAGYRSENLKIDEKNIMIDMKFDGPFAEAGVKF